jgi:hypothetical protein
MSDQLEIDFFSKAPVVTSEEMELLVQYLRGKGWVKGAMIECALGFNERKLRKLSEVSEGLIFSYPGSPGYKLFTSAVEIAEFERGDTLLAAQAAGIIRRRAAYRRRFHSCCKDT